MKFPPLIELAGSPAELGRRHGEVLGREIRQMRRAFLHYLARLTLFLGAWPLSAALQLLSRRYFWPHIPMRLKEELKGVAAGAGVGLSLVLLLNTLDDLANNWPACSALALGEGRTADGLYLGGRNLDYPVFVDVLVNLQTLFLITPDNGFPFASLAWPGYVGVLTGMNRAGVALAQLTAFCRDRSLRGLPAGLRNRLVMEGATDIDKAAAQLLAGPNTIGNNLLLISPRRALVVEVSARRGAIRRPVAGLLTVTNHFQSPAMAAVKGIFPRRPPLAVLEPYHFSEAYSQSRNACLQELASRRPLKAVDLQTILADPDIANAGTVSSVIFQPAALTLQVAQKGPPPVSRGDYADFDIGENH
ncbi:MAG: C45 family autoproteolytic acyltransferase/hydrolase [Desulfobaccales bacterium]